MRRIYFGIPLIGVKVGYFNLIFILVLFLINFPYLDDFLEGNVSVVLLIFVLTPFII